jgi:hypothetical protein
MGLDFSFDEISMDQRVSQEPIEIDLYDELITISDAEPDEQVRLLAIRPPAAGAKTDDMPESITVTGSLAKEQAPASVPVMASQTTAARTEIPVAPPPPNGTQPEPTVTAIPSLRTREITLPPPQIQPAVAEALRQPQPSAPLQKPSPAPAKVAPKASINVCSDCGQPAGELDMICIECGAFIG